MPAVYHQYHCILMNQHFHATEQRSLLLCPSEIILRCFNRIPDGPRVILQRPRQVDAHLNMLSALLFPEQFVLHSIGSASNSW
jgi:hypothetical protein